MNVFRFFADFLHLLSFILLMEKIRQSKNCLGNLNVIHIHRSFIQIIRNIFGSFFAEILGFIPLLRITIQYFNETSIYSLHVLYNISNKI